jgi:hydroxymethylpyrimidine pyrophosphatase-like HAD family hydrolase
LTKINIHTLNGSLHILREDRETMTEELFGELYKVTFNYEKNKELSEETVLVMNKIVKDTGILVVRSTYGCTELVDPMGTKEKATAYLKELFGAHTLVCVGDFENDIV